MHHITWIDLINGEFHEDYFMEHGKRMIEHYASQGFAQVLKIEAVKEDVK